MKTLQILASLTTGPRDLVELNDRLLVVAEPKGPGYGEELCVSNGTNDGTFDLDGPLGRLPRGRSMTAVSDRCVLFDGGGLWRTDSTIGGTALLEAGIREPSSFAVTAAGTVFFFATDPQNGRELRVYGTAVSVETAYWRHAVTYR